MTVQNTLPVRTHDRLRVHRDGVVAHQQEATEPSCIYNKAAKGVPFFTPAQEPAAGTGLTGPDGELPKLFTPIKIRGIEMQNRIWVSPMCQYSAHEGFQGAWHMPHYGGIVMRGVSSRFTLFPVNLH
jgi:hypothetical protein